MKKLIAVYLSLLFLLGFTVFASVTPMGESLSTGLSMAIAVAKASLVLVFFMNLNIASAKIRFFAFATLLWTLALISLISIDYLSRGAYGVFGK